MSLLPILNFPYEKQSQKRLVFHVKCQQIAIYRHIFYAESEFMQSCRVILFLPLLPGLACTKNGFPPMAITPAMIRTKNTGDNTIIASNDNIKSNTLLKNLSYICNLKFSGANHQTSSLNCAIFMLFHIDQPPRQHHTISLCNDVDAFAKHPNQVCDRSNCGNRSQIQFRDCHAVSSW